MINLFEYQNKIAIKEDFDGLESFLDEIWAKREKNSYYNEIFDNKIESQRFLQFIHKSNEWPETDAEKKKELCIKYGVALPDYMDTPSLTCKI